ncbi:MAG: NAD(+)--rifampin ADP-ribosyltransferase [Pseudomonadota bacterium]|nr:NAD(+)--rifampin ADP-ribosyltransferase [Pseudomonadota bacterium]
MTETNTPPPVIWYHGTKADLTVGDLIVAGKPSNFGSGAALSWVYFSATLEAAMWGAELARGNGPQRIFVVEPTGPYEDDPNLTDKKYPGNITRSYRSRDGLRIVGEVAEWTGHTSDEVARMKANVARIEAQGMGPID